MYLFFINLAVRNDVPLIIDDIEVAVIVQLAETDKKATKIGFMAFMGPHPRYVFLQNSPKINDG